MIAATAPAGRPEIVLSGRQLDAIADDAIDALAQANDPPSLFLRAGEVVALARDEDGRPLVREVGPDAVQERLAVAADWYTRTDRGLRDSPPSKSLATTVLRRLERQADRLPPLRGVTETPLLRPDGTLLIEAGYDGGTRLVYVPPPGFELPAVPQAPTPAQVEAAVGLLVELVCDFPFRSDADHAAALAALLTIALREAVTGRVPLFLFDAPAPGTGKGLLADVVSIAATGTLAGKAPEPDGRSDDEWRKRITALLLAGRAVCVIDNVERPLGSASLAAAITAESWEDRVLGASKIVTLPNRATWCATGNNLRLRGDLPRRCVWARLDARMARPWARDGFTHPNLPAWVAEHRGELLAAVFTLARGWIAAGRPGPPEGTPRLGGFEGWRSTIGGVLHVAGIPGLLGNVEALYAQADEDSPAWAAFLAGWWERFGPDAITTKELVDYLRGPPSTMSTAAPSDVADALENAKSATRSIGRALARREDTRFVVDDGDATLRLVRGGTESRNRSIRWKVARE